MTSVQIDKSSLSNVRLLLRGISDQAPKVLARALNETAKKAKTESRLAIRKEVNLKASYINQNLQVRRANFRNLQSRIVTPSRGILLTRFSTNAQVKSDKISWIKPPPNPARGIKVKVSPEKGAQLVEGGNDISGKPFYMALKNGRLAIAARRKTLGPRGGKIKVFSGPSLSQVFNNILKDLQAPMADYQEEQVSKQVDAVLRGF